mgnify:CR=1 FL=1
MHVYKYTTFAHVNLTRVYDRSYPNLIPVPQLAEVIIIPAKQLLGLRHLSLESSNAICRLAE